MAAKKQIVVKVCNGPRCSSRGASQIMEKIKKETRAEADNYELEFTSCLGCCDFGPNMLVNDNFVLGVTKYTAMDEIKKAALVTAPTATDKQANLNKALKEDILGDLS